MTTLEAAQEYLRKGFMPVPIPFSMKGPVFDGWQNFRTTADEITKHFSGKLNNGLLLGEPSGGLVDIDLDCTEAVAAAHLILPRTEMIHGRKSNPRSHYWYIAPGPKSEVKYNDPDPGKGEKANILEFRGNTGLQTMVPPSIHPEGETVVWYGALNPSVQDHSTLKTAVAELAAVVLIARRWHLGIKTDLALLLSGALVSLGVPLDRAERLITAISAAANDKKPAAKLKALRDTYERRQNGEHVTGIPKFKEHVGEKVFSRFAQWLGIDPDRQEPVMEHYTIEPTPEIQFSTFADTEKIVGSVTWAWPGWLPNGFLTMIVGMSGEGKSMALLALLNTFITGCNWPDGTPYTGETGAALWLETESAQGLNVDRVKKWGIPLDKIYNPFVDTLKNTRLDKPEHWAAIIEIARRPEVKIIVLDSLRGAHSGDENSSETFVIVNGLADLAKNIMKPVIALHHLRKASKDEKGDISLDRIRGSSAIAQPARVIWALDTPDYRTETKRLYVIKTNFKDRPTRIGFTIKDDGLEFGEAPTPPVKETNTDKAINLLLVLLRDGPMKAKDIYERGKLADLSEKVLREGKKRLGCGDYQDEDDKGWAWYWKLP